MVELGRSSRRVFEGRQYPTLSDSNDGFVLAPTQHFFDSGEGIASLWIDMLILKVFLPASE